MHNKGNIFKNMKAVHNHWTIFGGLYGITGLGCLTVLTESFLSLALSLLLGLFLFLSNGTSMISLIIPPKDQISRVAKMLADEFGTASNIKSRVNRLSVLGAITSVQQRLKLYNKGVCVFLVELFWPPSL